MASGSAGFCSTVTMRGQSSALTAPSSSVTPVTATTGTCRVSDPAPERTAHVEAVAVRQQPVGQHHIGADPRQRRVGADDTEAASSTRYPTDSSTMPIELARIGIVVDHEDEWWIEV